ncbi:hypothetical protein SAMN05444266_105466 [Chitinophaga jiangningensis]|uniref:GLPGLI family protein n=1 Tax=Chitinophaga jiangningensis TaxID=1419482 RepID=A0A1M7EIZ2_9BACT|nr:hypothetical protein [Chitinophaga jiangningensis]SHL91742.1 hypothetical protein SAMN05444266_105466 [Chitinophaga jiangningensis]
MKKVLCTWCLLIACCFAIAQQPPASSLIIYANTYQQGLYHTFREFQTNAPSENGNLVIKDRSSAAQMYLLADKNQLVIRDATGERKVKDYWGYCDGQHIYVRDNGLNKIIETGYYCIYFQRRMQPAGRTYNPADMTTGPMNVSVECYKVINIITGEILELSAYNLKKYILPQDPELLQEFRTDKEKKDKLLWYIRKFNQRNHPVI